jgi:hypothetical protein
MINGKLTKDDFVLDRKETPDGHEDYWFKTANEADEYLVREYNDMCLEHVFEVVYSKDEDWAGVKRQFRFNYDVVEAKDDLKSILKSLCV